MAKFESLAVLRHQSRAWTGRPAGRRAALLPGACLSTAAWPDKRVPWAHGTRLNLPAPRAGPPSISSTTAPTLPITRLAKVSAAGVSGPDALPWRPLVHCAGSPPTAAGHCTPPCPPNPHSPTVLPPFPLPTTTPFPAATERSTASEKRVKCRRVKAAPRAPLSRPP